MKDETIDERITRLERNLYEAREEKKNAILKSLMKPGTKVYIVGEIKKVDPEDSEQPYFVLFNDGEDVLWINAEDIKEIK